VLDSKTVAKLNAVFEAQEQATGDQIVFAIFKALPEEDLVVWTNRIFKSWKLGQAGKDNGVLLALYWKDRRARIEVGYGLEPLLTDARAKRVLSDILIPALKQGQPAVGLTGAALAILSTIQSPLITDGRAQKILQSQETPLRPVTQSGDSSLFLHIFILVLVVLLIRFLKRKETHYSHSGWRRSGGFPWGRSSGWWDVGGSDRGGGDSGFHGGGGSSGGGGASDRW
jgi:uncharacterized protein